MIPITGNEIIDLVIMSVGVGYIFMDVFQRPKENPWDYHAKTGFDWDNFWYALAVVAPSIILHEMAHKFSALYFGLEATFHAAYEWLALGIGLKLLKVGFIFFVPGYVRISGIASNFAFAIVAFLGPAVHLLLWLGSKKYLGSASLSQGKEHFWILVMQINKFLFIFNMLPIPGFDGFSVYRHLIGIVL